MFTKIVAPTVLAVVIFLLVRPLIVRAIEGPLPSNDHGEVVVEADKEKNSQVYLLEDGKKTQLSESGVPSTDQFSGERYAVWMSQHEANWQIHAYDFRIDQQFQLTFTGNNVNPQTNGSFIVWEGQQDGIWTVFLFDGTQVTEISKGDQPVQELILEKNLLTFLQKDLTGKGWIGFYYDLSTRQLSAISEGQLVAELKIHRGVISWKNADNTQGKIVTANAVLFPTPTPPPVSTQAPVESEEEEILPTDVQASTSATPPLTLPVTTSPTLPEAPPVTSLPTISPTLSIEVPETSTSSAEQ